MKEEKKMRKELKIEQIEIPILSGFVGNGYFATGCCWMDWRTWSTILYFFNSRRLLNARCGGAFLRLGPRFPGGLACISIAGNDDVVDKPLKRDAHMVGSVSKPEYFSQPGQARSCAAGSMEDDDRKRGNKG